MIVYHVVCRHTLPNGKCIGGIDWFLSIDEALRNIRLDRRSKEDIYGFVVPLTAYTISLQEISPFDDVDDQKD